MNMTLKTYYHKKNALASSQKCFLKVSSSFILQDFILLQGMTLSFASCPKASFVSFEQLMGKISYYSSKFPVVLTKNLVVPNNRACLNVN